MFWPFKRKKKYTYKLKEFTKQRRRNGCVEVYHESTGQWMYWHLITMDTQNSGEQCTNSSISTLPRDLDINFDTSPLVEFSNQSERYEPSQSVSSSSSSYESSSSSSDWSSSSSSSDYGSSSSSSDY